MSGSSKNANLNRARKNDNDEFYTRVADIKKEIIQSGRYDGLFFNKTVLCNCNDCGKSGFKLFFHSFFKKLGMKELILTSYGENAYVSVYDGNTTRNFPLCWDGSFDSPECLKILHCADIVCTNPPFSLFRNFIKTVIGAEKDFLIVGNINEMLCLDIFPMYMDGTVSYGAEKIKMFDTRTGEKSFGNIGWYTNFPDCLKKDLIPLNGQYFGHEGDYPFYDNFKAISIGRVSDIPCDYYGMMGVPSSYLARHNPEQFELIGTSGMLAGDECFSDGTIKKNPGRFYLNGTRLYERIVIRRKGIAKDGK